MCRVRAPVHKRRERDRRGGHRRSGPDPELAASAGPTPTTAVARGGGTPPQRARPGFSASDGPANRRRVSESTGWGVGG